MKMTNIESANNFIKYINGFVIDRSYYIINITFGDIDKFALTPALTKAFNIELTKIIKSYEKKYGKIVMEDVVDPDEEESKKNSDYQ